jgi:hypothetical protein
MKLVGKAFLQQTFFRKKLYHPPSKHFSELGGVLNGDMVKRVFFIDTSFQNDAIPVWIPSHQVTIRKHLKENQFIRSKSGIFCYLF